MESRAAYGRLAGLNGMSVLWSVRTQTMGGEGKRVFFCWDTGYGKESNY